MRKLLYTFIHPLRKLYWFLIRPKTFGVKSVLENDGRLLMIRNTYGSKRWTFPGGKINRGEEPSNAAKRETFEEVGVIVKNPVYLGSYFNQREYKNDTVHCYYAPVNGTDFKIDPVEIEEASWFPIDSLPKDLSAGAVDTLRIYLSKKQTRNTP